MSESNNFYKKIGEKLSSHEPPFSDEAWLNFQPQLREKLLPWYRNWYWPYLYSSALAVLLFAYFQLNRSPQTSGDTESQAAVSTTRVDTLYQVDTIYIRKTVYVQEEIKQVYAQDNRQTTTADTFTVATATHDFSHAEEVFKTEEVAISKGEDNASTAIIPQGPAASGQTAHKQSATAPPTANAYDPGMDWKSLFEQEKDTLNGKDEANLSTKTRPLFILEAGVTGKFPIHPFVEYPVVGLQQISLGLEWASGWGLFTGFYHGSFKGEIDDDDFDLLSARQLNQLPSSGLPLSDIDEIYLEQNQLFFPLEIRWRSAPVDAFSFETGFGLVGSYIRNQRVRYEFEDRLGLPDSEMRLPVRDFSVSHLKISVGTQAILSEKLSIYLRSSYWQPISGTGLLDLRIRGIDVGVGVQVAF
ncbi:hypothetical protein A3SI_18166 [Nitritalea halalkaliphila LW7]|uniref:Outer membrane protein beta-barrel domain-containing protein n=1 Tax=Nitritalea halalkaliphila LW7 TaxID=1189621 RepID=I5BUW2_9BACT|nr:hypothetical protein [Nitritalea halalkaliphila]EIM73364.1 hypothetical protein A3SI_18166 [Nitritalea halalkaliphila LW7]